MQLSIHCNLGAFYQRLSTRKHSLQVDVTVGQPPLLSSRNRCNKHSIYSRPTVTSCQEAPGDYLCTATTLECGIVELRSSAVLLSYVASKRFRRSVINVCRCTLETCNRYNDQWEKVNTDTKAAFFVLQAKKLYTFMLITNRG